MDYARSTGPIKTEAYATSAGLYKMEPGSPPSPAESGPGGGQHYTAATTPSTEPGYGRGVSPPPPPPTSFASYDSRSLVGVHQTDVDSLKGSSPHMSPHVAHHASFLSYMNISHHPGLPPQTQVLLLLQGGQFKM